MLAIPTRREHAARSSTVRQPLKISRTSEERLKLDPDLDLPVPLGASVLLRDVERNGPRPRLLDEVSHLLDVDRLEANMDPVEPHVAVARQLELLRLRVDCGLSHLLREAAPHSLTVLGEREPHDLA